MIHSIIMMDTLPDDVLVKISITVAGLCGAGDFWALSHSSRRLYSLLVGSQTTIQTVLHHGSQKLHRSLLLPQQDDSKRTIQNVVVESIPQLHRYECLRDLKLLHETKILGIAGRSSNSGSVQVFDALDLHGCLQALSERIPVINLGTTKQSSTSNAAIPFYVSKTKHYLHHDFCFRWQTVYEVLWKHLYLRSTKTNHNHSSSSSSSCNWISLCSFDNNHERIMVRSWNEPSLSSQHHEPMVVARKGSGWIEVFFQMSTSVPKCIELFPQHQHQGYFNR